MRLFLAAIFFLFCVFLITTAIMKLLPENRPEWVTPVAVLVGAVLSLYLTNKLVNVRGTRFWRIRRGEVSVEELEQQNAVRSVEFHAKRAFQVEELHEEGSNYIIELQDGTVLFLTGHYFYEHEPLEVDGSIVQRREFPNTKFVIRRDEEGNVIDIVCRGRVLEPEVVTPPFNPAPWNPPAPAGGGKRSPANGADSQSREVALFNGAPRLLPVGLH